MRLALVVAGSLGAAAAACEQPTGRRDTPGSATPGVELAAAPQDTRLARGAQNDPEARSTEVQGAPEHDEFEALAGPLAASLADEPGDPPSIRRQAWADYKAKRFAAARAGFARLSQLDTKAWKHPFNLACVSALMGEEDQARIALVEAVARGGAAARKKASRDKDLARVRGAAWFDGALFGLPEHPRLSDVPAGTHLPSHGDGVARCKEAPKEWLFEGLSSRGFCRHYLAKWYQAEAFEVFLDCWLPGGTQCSRRIVADESQPAAAKACRSIERELDEYPGGSAANGWIGQGRCEALMSAMTAKGRKFVAECIWADCRAPGCLTANVYSCASGFDIDPRELDL